jgi:hypothetical protein
MAFTQGVVVSFFCGKAELFGAEGGYIHQEREHLSASPRGEEAGVRGLVAPPPFPPAYPKSIQSPCGLSLSKSSSEPQSGSQNVLGPVPGVGVMAKRPPGLLNVGDSFPRTPGCFRAHLRGSRGRRRGGALLFARLQGDALGGPGSAWVQLGPPLARGAAPAGELTAASNNTGTSKRALALYFCFAQCIVCGRGVRHISSPPQRGWGGGGSYHQINALRLLRQSR